jgi:hypothetical protein
MLVRLVTNVRQVEKPKLFVMADLTMLLFTLSALEPKSGTLVTFG